MRKAFADAVIDKCAQENWFFLTGDLGFMALEGIQDVMKERFINCGVAEQNMIGVAAGIAREGFRVFAYSIAPFCYGRPFEQIRNDICFGNLPVCLVGNGGGYAYGHMGPTHHALEDCAAMSSLDIHVIAPAFDEDVSKILENISGPTYLRLGYDVRPKGSAVSQYAPFRKILEGGAGTMVAFGPLAGLAWEALNSFSPDSRPALWAITELPLNSLPEDFCRQINGELPFAIIEEHVVQGGLGMQLLHALTIRGIFLHRLCHKYALRYPSGRYGSQNFHRAECDLDLKGITNLVHDWESL